MMPEGAIPRDPGPAPRRELRGAMYVWVLCVLLFTTITAIAIPLRFILGAEALPLFQTLENIITVVFFLDIAVNFPHARQARSRSAVFFIAADVVAAVPFSLLMGWFPLVFLRLVKLVRVAYWMGIWRHHHLNRWNTLRLVYFIYWFTLSVHWLASGWLFTRGIPPGSHGWTQYLHSLYWCVSTLTTIGYGDITPANNTEIVYAMVVMIFGVGMYGYVIGNVSTIISNLQPARVRYLSNMEKLGAFMRYRGIPSGLQQRIRDYHAYVWEQRMGFDESSVIEGLPPGLFTEVLLFLKRDIIQKVPLFKGASEELIRDIALQMRPVVYTPGDYVSREGEAGLEMYFISRGRLEVIGRDGKTVIATLGDGEFFGEIALLLNQPRSATVRALSYCDLYTLDKAGFDRVIEKYPEFAAVIRTMTAVRKKRHP